MFYRCHFNFFSFIESEIGSFENLKNFVMSKEKRKPKGRSTCESTLRMVLVLYFQKGRLCIIIQISTISEHIANLTKGEEKVRECSELSIVITFEPHTTSSEDRTMKEVATAILFAITVVSLFCSKD